MQCTWEGRGRMLLSMVATSIDDFHRWRVACPQRAQSAIVVVTASDLAGEIPGPVSRYLNEYDEEAENGWTAFNPELISEVALRGPERALLGVPDGCATCPAGSACLQKKVCKAVADLGHAILEGPLAMQATRDLKNVFRIAIGVPMEALGDVHLAIHPHQFAAHYLPVLIGDTFLEWVATRGLVDRG